MFNKFIKKSSKFFAVLLTVTLAFTPLSYANPITTFSELNTAIVSDGTPNTITIGGTLEATDTDEELGRQKIASLTIEGDYNIVDGKNHAAGMEIKVDGYEQSTTLNNITFQNFTKFDGYGSVISNDQGELLINNSSFKNNTATGDITKKTPTGVGAVIQTISNEDDYGVRGSLTVIDSLFENNSALGASAIFATGKMDISDTVFRANETAYLGTLTSVGSSDYKSRLSNVLFEANVSSGTQKLYPNAGAIYFGEENVSEIANSKFTANISAGNGGAINMDPLMGSSEPSDFSKSKLDVTG